MPAPPLLLLFGQGSGVSLPPDLLAAVKAFFIATPALTTAFPGGLHQDPVPRKPTYPHVLIQDYQQVEPSRSPDDKQISLTFSIRTIDTNASNGFDQAKVLGDILASLFDPNPNRSPFTWQTGSENFNWRDTTRLYKQKGLGPGNSFVSCYDIPYEFWVEDSALE